jgi:uncharacterized membrane protein YkoI
MKKIICMILVGALLAPSMAVGQTVPQAQTTPVAKITAEQATKIALERIPGKVTSVVMERKLGKNVYTVEIQTPKGEKDVFVDVETGRIVGTE